MSPLKVTITGVKYGVRRLPGDNWGIHVKTYRDGTLETENLNTAPWPSRAVALDRALRSAKAEAEREGMTVLGELDHGP